MALWPFGKKNRNQDTPDSGDAGAPVDAAAPVEPAAPETPAESVVEENAGIQAVVEHDAVGGESGPFDGDSVNIDDFDFSDFGTGVLNLGSMRIPMPTKSQVQLEMGETGPRMIHIVTPFGRVTPVAFAAPKVAGQWESASEELVNGMREQGMETHFEQGPWGREVVGVGPKATMRIIGVDGPRWMLRLTLAAPSEKAEDLAKLGREIAARVFVYRGQDPILAGNSLPVAVPQQLMQQVQQAMKKRQEEQQAAQNQQPGTQQPQGGADAQAVQEAAAALQALRNQLKPQQPGPDTPPSNS